MIPRIFFAASGRDSEFCLLGDDYQTPDGTCIRDYVHVEDLADAHILTLEAPAETAGAYNVATGRGYSVREVLDAARRITGRAIPVRVTPRRPGDPPELVADPSRIRQVLGWRARHDLDSVLSTAWAFYVRQG